MNSETLYTVHALLIFNWSDTCWECIGYEGLTFFGSVRNTRKFTRSSLLNGGDGVVTRPRRRRNANWDWDNTSAARWFEFHPDCGRHERQSRWCMAVDDRRQMSCLIRAPVETVNRNWIQFPLFDVRLEIRRESRTGWRHHWRHHWRHRRRISPSVRENLLRELRRGTSSFVWTNRRHQFRRRIWRTAPVSLVVLPLISTSNSRRQTGYDCSDNKRSRWSW